MIGPTSKTLQRLGAMSAPRAHVPLMMEVV